MSTYAELTPEQRDILAQFERLERAWVGELARLLGQADRLAEAWAANVSGIVSALNAGTVIPNSSGLRGAESLTREQVQALGTFINGLRTAYGTQANRELWSRVAGLDNTVAR